MLFTASKFGLVGILVGALALTAAVFQDQIRAVYEPPPERSLSEVAAELGSRLLQGKRDEPVLSKSTTSDPVTLAHMGLGVIAILLGVVGFVRKEDKRVAGAAIALGIVGAAWVYVVIAAIFAVVIVVVAAVIGN